MKTYKGNCCGKRSVLEKILIVVVVLLLCLLITLFTVFILHLQNGKRDSFIRIKTVTSPPNEQSEAAFLTAASAPHRNEAAPCTSQQCVTAASQIIDFIDPSVDPCDDFYSFVCGNFLNKSRALNELTPLSKLHGATLSQLDSLITDPVPEPIPKSWELQRKYFKVCMNTQAIDDDDDRTFLNLVKKLGDWPVLLGRFWNQKKFTWLQSIIDCRNTGFSYDHFLSFSIADVSNGTGSMVLSISPPDVITVPYQFREFYINMMANISVDLGAPQYLAKNEFIRVFEFEQQIRNFAGQERQNGHVIRISKLQSDFPGIQWKDFLNEVTKAPVPFDDDTLVLFRAEVYLTHLLELLSRTSASTQANYVIWKIIENFRYYLKESIRTRFEMYLSVYPYYGAMNNRYLYCLNNAKFYFPSVAELAYVRQYLEPFRRSDIIQMTTRIKNQLISKIRKNDWLDEVSKNQFASKVSKVEEHIGSSEQAYSEDFDKVVDMEGFDLDSDNIMEMTTKLYVKRTDNSFKVLNRQTKEIRRELLQRSPDLSINAFLNEPFNTLVVPAPFLQGVIYNFQRPRYMNYGALGSVIGHELTHSFMSERETGRWSPETTQHYQETTKCLLDDYQKYPRYLNEFVKNAESAFLENIADIIGAQASYHAYQEWSQQKGQEQTLPSLNYTPNQMFWIMSGVFKCYQPPKQGIRFDERHGIPPLAATFSVKNSPEFATDFSCPVGTNMNPAQKCKII